MWSLPRSESQCILVLAGSFLTTGPPGKSQHYLLDMLLFHFTMEKLETIFVFFLLQYLVLLGVLFDFSIEECPEFNPLTFSIYIHFQDPGWQSFPIKSQTVKYFRLCRPHVSVAATQLCCHNEKSALGTVKTNGDGCA